MPPRRRPPGGLYAMGRGYAEEDGSGRGRSGKHTIVVWSARGLDVIPLSLWLLYFSCVYAERDGGESLDWSSGRRLSAWRKIGVWEWIIIYAPSSLNVVVVLRHCCCFDHGLFYGKLLPYGRGRRLFSVFLAGRRLASSLASRGRQTLRDLVPRC